LTLGQPYITVIPVLRILFVASTFFYFSSLSSCQSSSVEERLAKAIADQAQKIDTKTFEKKVADATNHMSAEQKAKLKKEAQQFLDRL
jgi:hypothetical protein